MVAEKNAVVDVEIEGPMLRVIALEHAVKLRCSGHAPEGVEGIVNDADAMYKFLKTGSVPQKTPFADEVGYPWEQAMHEDVWHLTVNGDSGPFIAHSDSLNGGVLFTAANGTTVAPGDRDQITDGFMIWRDGVSF